MIIPDSLQNGDTIAILAPATRVNPEFVRGAEARLLAEGCNVRVFPSALGDIAEGSYSAPFATRLAELTSAFADPEIKAILCARGGYGCARLIDKFEPEFLRENAKWMIGFSDISALHAMMGRAGVASIHGPMAKHIATSPADDYCTQALLRILRTSQIPEYFAPHEEENIPGTAEGILVGGNLTVLNDLAATPFDVFARADNEDIILVLEDIGEAIYAVERMMRRLMLAGTLGKLKGIIFGHFTEYRADRDYADMELMLTSLMREAGLENPERAIPVVYGFPAGHTPDNLPLVLNVPARLAVTPEATLLSNFEF